MKILLVEDDDRIAGALAEDLSDSHYAVDIAEDGQAAWDLSEAYDYDLILLDVMLPRIDGITLCKRWRKNGCKTPILMLTARDTGDDMVTGLDAGADDYVVKPFDLDTLSARIRALLRRGEISLPPNLEWGDLTLNPNAQESYYQTKLLGLTPTEFRLLELFMRNPRRVFSRSAILDKLWPYADAPEEETVKMHILGLRRKLKQAGADTDLIETVYGVGYRLKHDEE